MRIINRTYILIKANVSFKFGTQLQSAIVASGNGV